MLTVLAARLEKLVNAEPTTELFQDCVKYHLITTDSERTMPFLRWDEKKKELVPASKPGLPVQQVQKTLANILRLMADTTLTIRFHALKKPLENTTTNTAIPWLWTTSMRQTELWSELTTLCYHSIWRLTLVQLRPQTLTRQPLAKLLQQTL